MPRADAALYTFCVLWSNKLLIQAGFLRWKTVLVVVEVEKKSWNKSHILGWIYEKTNAALFCGHFIYHKQIHSLPTYVYIGDFYSSRLLRVTVVLPRESPLGVKP